MSMYKIELDREQAKALWNLIEMELYNMQKNQGTLQVNSVDKETLEGLQKKVESQVK